MCRGSWFIRLVLYTVKVFFAFVCFLCPFSRSPLLPASGNIKEYSKPQAEHKVDVKAFKMCGRWRSAQLVHIYIYIYIRFSAFANAYRLQGDHIAPDGLIIEAQSHSVSQSLSLWISKHWISLQWLSQPFGLPAELKTFRVAEHSFCGRSVGLNREICACRAARANGVVQTHTAPVGSGLRT